MSNSIAMTQPEIQEEVNQMTLTEMESHIRNNYDNAIRVGLCLRRIKEQKLYKEKYGTFEKFCNEGLGISDRHGRRLVMQDKINEEVKNRTRVSGNENGEAEDQENVSRVGQIAQLSHRETAELAKIAPEKRPEVLQKARESGQVTAKSIREASEKTEGALPVDKTGYRIPEEVIDLWNREQEPKDLLQKLSVVRGAMKTAMNDEDILYRELNFSLVITDLSTVFSSVKTAVPFAVCPYCSGRNAGDCKACRGRGIMSEFKWKNVPKEFKAIREKIVADYPSNKK